MSGTLRRLAGRLEHAGQAPIRGGRAELARLAVEAAAELALEGNPGVAREAELVLAIKALG